jgi:hypothetical protein
MKVYFTLDLKVSLNPLRKFMKGIVARKASLKI